MAQPRHPPGRRRARAEPLTLSCTPSMPVFLGFVRMPQRSIVLAGLTASSWTDCLCPGPVMSPTAQQVPPSLFLPDRPFLLTVGGILHPPPLLPAQRPTHCGVAHLRAPRCHRLGLANFRIFRVQYYLAPEGHPAWMGTRTRQLGASP